MSRPWMPLYVADYLGDTRRLSTLQHGAYMLLIMEYWVSGSLPTDDDELAIIAGLTPKEWAKVRPAIIGKFLPGWKHKRVEEELAKASEISERRKASADKRWSKRDANADANASPNADANDMHRAGVPQPQLHSPSLRSGESTREKPRLEDQCEPVHRPMPTAHEKPDVDLRMKILGLYRELGVPAPAMGQSDVWLAQGYPAAMILAVLRTKIPRAVGKPLAWFSGAIREAAESKAPVAPTPVEIDWPAALKRWRETEYWPANLGPRPGMAGCRAPRHLVEAAA